MAVLRQENWLGNQRVDIPHLRSIESAVAGDFDLFAGIMFAGKAPLIISGFYVISTGVTVATNLQIQVAGSSLIDYLASESGSIFGVPSNRPNELLSSTNPRVSGSFTPSMVNYVGLDLVRSADDTTVDLVEFIDSDSELETPVQVPLGRTLDYRIVVTTLDFDNNPGICPIAKVTLDSNGNITSLVDSRQIAFRLGSGGTAPNIKNSYSWPAGRSENVSGDIFIGGDKAVSSFKSWMDAVMSRLWEVGGGEFWYSPTEYGNEKLTRSGTPFVSNGEYMEWTGTNLHWKGLAWVFANSTAVTNAITDQITDAVGLTDLSDGECIYVDVDRTTDAATLNAVKGSLADLGSPVIPGSRYVLAWRHGANIYTRDQSYFIGSSFKAATVSAAGTVKISASDALPVSPVWVATVDSTTFIAKAAGLSRGFFPGQATPAMADDFIGSSGNILIGGGWDGADGSGGGNPVDFNVILRTVRSQDTIYLSGAGSYQAAGAPNVAVVSPYADSVQQSKGHLLQYAVGILGSLRVVQVVYGDGSIGFINIEDTNVTAAGLPDPPTPVFNAEVRSKLFTHTNGLASPNKRDQLCWIAWDGTVYVLQESNPY